MLREEFGRADQPAVPERDAMLARITRVRRRRMAVMAVGGSAVAVAVVSGVAAAVSLSPSSSNGTPVGDGLPPRMYQAELISALFTDQQHGYVVQEGCSMDIPGEVPDDAPTPDIHQECTSQMLATTDGGQTWQSRALPGDPATKDAGVDLVQGHSLMLWIDDAGRLAYGGWNRRYWTTEDGGVTWIESQSLRDVGPVGSYGTFGLGDTLTFLHTAPPATAAFKKPVVAAKDGSFWVAASSTKTHNALAVTRDHGSTWQFLSTLDSAESVEWVSTADGQTLYASVRTAAGSRLARSSDAGVTWSEVLDLAHPGAAGLALPNGDLILAEASEEGGMYRLEAGASVLEKLTEAPAHPNALYLSGDVIVAAPAWDQREEPDLDSVVSVSADGGTTWTAAPPPSA